MKRILLFIIICTLEFPVMPFTSNAAKDTWRGMHSKNFYLIGNASEKDIRQVATRLEQFREAFTTVFPSTRTAASQPITVIVFKNHASFEPFMPAHNGRITQVAGYFLPNDEGRYILLTSEMEGDFPYSVIFHEYVHNLSEDSSRPLPTWLSEGLAELYSTFRVSGDKKVSLGIPLSDHIYELRQSKFLTLPELFSINTNSNEYNEGDKRSIFYAESWALVHYMIMGDSARRQKLQKFILSINAGVSMDDSFRQAFQMDYQTMQKELQDYVKQSKYHYVTYELNEKLDFDKNAQTVAISEAEAEYQLGSVLSLQMRTDGETHLRNAVALDPNMADAHALLGRVLMYQGKVTEAKEHLEHAVTADSKSYLAHYYYAWALSREGADDKRRLVNSFPTANIPKIRNELIRAIELNPNYVEAYHLLGFVNLIDNKEIDETIQLMNRALAISPGNENVNLILGQLYLHKSDFESARKIMEPLTRTAKSPELRAMATDIMRQLDMAAEVYKQYHDSGNKSSSSPDTSTSSTTTGNTNTATPPGPPRLKRRGEETSGLCISFPGEQVKGFLTELECTRTGFVLFIEAEGKTIKFETDSSKLKMVTCGLAGGEDFTCGALKKPRAVTVFYQKQDNPKKGFEGLANAIVFVQPPQ